MIDVQLSSLDEARILVLGLGTDAKIIEPDVLREAVLVQAQQIMTQFSPR
jgi:predicted DNA-binding transcriptional regulator YafY